jgi:hypothetical protein
MESASTSRPQHDGSTWRAQELKHDYSGAPGDNHCGDWQIEQYPDLRPTGDSAPSDNLDTSDLHALLASMPVAEALDFAIDYLGTDMSTDTACFDTPDGSSHDGFT